MIFSEEQEITTILCDQDDRLMLWGAARMFQDIACRQSDSLGVGFEGLRPSNKAWVLTRVYYSVLRLPRAGERVTMRTWAKQDNGLIAPRDSQMLDAEGNLLIACASNWVIIDMLTRRVCRLGDIIGLYEKEDLHSSKYTKLDNKLHIPDFSQVCFENANPGGTPFDSNSLLQDRQSKHITVPYSAIDHTHHVNNAEYIKWICDSIPDIVESRFLPDGTCKANKEIREFEIQYLKETAFTDNDIQLSRLDVDGDMFFQLTNSQGISVNAKVVLD